MDDIRVERVLRAVECIPDGSVATYGDIGNVTGESARVIGRVLALWGSTVPWWRVCNSKGEIPGHSAEALELWLADKLPIKAHGSLELVECRVNVAALKDQVATVFDGLEGNS